MLLGFWESKEPCNWNAVDYLIELYDKNPLLLRRTAHKYLLEDAKILKELALPDTVAESMLSFMCSFNKV